MSKYTSLELTLVYNLTRFFERAFLCVLSILIVTFHQNAIYAQSLHSRLIKSSFICSYIGYRNFMNNIFKTIWNHATQSWVATSELSRAKGKTKSVKTALVTAVGVATH